MNTKQIALRLGALILVSLWIVSLIFFFSGELKKTTYKGVVESKEYEAPTSGYRTSKDPKYIVYMTEDITHKVIRTEVTVPVYFKLKKGDRTSIDLTNSEMYRLGNIRKTSEDFYEK